ncbi:MerR family transcriptional regulator [Solibacillus cecembensis]|uniref:MerR family transcriptional regulator n=1 Tax=Solibacillus cecembensis TaxID=459347 RepID=UPI000716ED87
MQIKAFSKKFNVPIDTIRYYEKEGLLQPKRLENGYRQYDESCADQLKMIIVLKQLDFTLQEIYQLSGLKMEQITPECNQATVSIFNQKLQQITDRIEFYQHAMQTLEMAKQLIQEEKYSENQMIINQSVEELFNRSHLKDVRYD